MLIKKYEEAEQCYKEALTLTHLSDAPLWKKIKRIVRTEYLHFSPKKHSTPVLDVRE
jgi:hypothetical protein